jgi:ABC-type transport system involved in multi-copper enzyme maturation permease subunit
VLAAKSIVFFTVAFVFTLVASAFVAMVQVSMLEGAGARTPSGSEWFKATVGISLYIALLGLLSLLIGSVIRHSAGAITIMIGVVLAPLVIAMFMVAQSMEKLRDWLFEYSIPNQLSVFYSNSLTESGPSGWDPLWIMLGLTAAVYAGTYALLRSRDV